MGKRWVVSVTVVAAALVACNALTGVGDLVIDSNTSPDGSSSDAGVITPPTDDDGGVRIDEPDAGGLVPVDAAIVDGCSTTSCELLPDGFQLVSLGDGTAPCPAGFVQGLDGVENPTVDPGACTCGCDLTKNPSCALQGGGSMSLLFGPAGSGTCTASGQSVSTECSTDGFLGPFITYDRRYDAPKATLTGGSCAAKANKEDGKLHSTNARVCQATVIARCEDKTCISNNDKFATCVAAAGDLTCPAAWPKRHLVGASASFTCGAGCSCNVDGKCSNTGSLSYFSTDDCTGPAGFTYPVGGCNTTQGGNTVYASHRYDPAPPESPSCKAGGSSAPNIVLGKPTTVCCR